MGLKSLAKKGAKTVANKLKNENLRKYVWYDYSIVEKAKIQIIESNGWLIGSCIPGSQNELEFVAELPVQINPSEFRYEHHADPTSIINKLEHGKLAEGFVLYSTGDHETSLFSPTLTFDIYDEYNARTANGTLPTDFSLMNDTATSLPSLIKYATCVPHRFARFIWGDIIKFGLLAGISVDYTTFSQWGQPLKATATLNIIEEPLQGNINGLPGFSSKKTAAKGVATGLKNAFR